MRKLLFVMCLAAATAACGSEDEADEAKVQPTLASIQKNVFDKSCSSSSCHGESKQGGLDLRAGASYAALIDVEPDKAAAKDAGLVRVKPGDPDKSFLVVKLGTVPSGMGARMPQGGRPLDSATIQAIRDWIANGAQQ